MEGRKEGQMDGQIDGWRNGRIKSYNGGLRQAHMEAYKDEKEL